MQSWDVHGLLRIANLQDGRYAQAALRLVSKDFLECLLQRFGLILSAALGDTLPHGRYPSHHCTESHRAIPSFGRKSRYAVARLA